jgi:hypothetical protein
LEQRLETVLALEPVRTFEAFFDALAAMSETAQSGADVRFHRSARPRLGSGGGALG